MGTSEKSLNFSFLLQGHEPVFHRIALGAERAFSADPNTTVMKCRQLAEAFAQHAAAAVGVWSGPNTTFADLVRALESKRVVERDSALLFRQLRITGNDAAHSFTESHQVALDQLRFAHKLAVWFHRTFGPVSTRGSFKPHAFTAPEDPSARLRDLEDAARRARAEADAHKAEAAAAKAALAAEEARRIEAERVATAAEAERAEWERFAGELGTSYDADIVELQQSNAALQALAVRDIEAQKTTVALAIAASDKIELDESDTRAIIDAQIRAAGWEVDSRSLRYSKGARPEAGKNRAIAEWPTKSGPADYVFFLGLTPVAVVEAKKIGKAVVSDLGQSKRYSRDYLVKGDETLPGPALTFVADFTGWPTTKGATSTYRIPFLYTANGRPYIKQFENESGVWFQDVRASTNHPRALAGWHSPEHLSSLLAGDQDAAHAALQVEPVEYLGLRDYQVRAIHAVEDAISAGQRSLLVAMATGTGKTKTTIGLLYRLLKTKRFERVLFLVDREALGIQAQNAFKEMRLEANQTFTEIYEVRELSDKAPEKETKVHVATVQGMVKRIFAADTDTEVPIDRYDCIVVDESHRGYTLDREMSEGEAETRSFADYVSTYRRVLDHFDAVKIGLTATPALHTHDIFGASVFTYTYREAVIDGFLIDHEPPLRFVTQLAATGIHYQAGEAVTVLQTSQTVGSSVQLSFLPDQLDFDVEDFNKRVINENFNRVVCEELAKHLDPSGLEKTLIFCVNDRHADLVVGLLKKALTDRLGPIDDEAVQKITGSVDRPMDSIRRYMNERLPNIAVTVDLLSTGIDVPEITNIVFIRRVKSRILYEQMLGRATRLCDDIGKTVFRIYDAVDLYAALEPFSTMKPVVKNVSTPLRKLIEQLSDAEDRRQQTKKTSADAGVPAALDDAIEELFEEIVAKMRRSVRTLVKKPPKGDKALAVEGIEALLGSSLADVPTHVQTEGARKLVERMRVTPELMVLFERALRPPGEGAVVISDHDDAMVSVAHGYGDGITRPEDYLSAFERFLNENMNTLPALLVVTQRPRALTRAQLRELKVKLDTAGFTEPRLQTAWRDLKNQDIAATIIGFIRQRALGSPLVPYRERVERALRVVEGLHPWTAPERKWLARIAEQLKQETIVDEAAFMGGAFENEGGYKGIDRKLGGRLGEVLDTFGDAIWDDTVKAA